jgi:alanine-glyoxylate transaminase / serine-glyoxylate transaminase / serine-pyruvate transaminase
VLVVHNETATGVTTDIAGLREAMDAAKHPALLLVDGVSSIGSLEFQQDAWGVDVAITGSQKGFMMPAGLGMVSLSPRAMERIETAGFRGTTSTCGRRCCTTIRAISLTRRHSRTSSDCARRWT